MIPTRDFTEGKYLAFATANGLVKKTEFLKYNTPIRADGIIAIKVREDDELVQVRLTSGEDDLLMVSKSGHASRFHENLARPMGRGTSGVKGMNVADKGNRVLSLDVVQKDTELLVVTENGYGKRTAISEYPVKGRGTKGVLTIKLTAKKGGLAGALIVRDEDELVFISQNGMVQRTAVSDISQQGRATQGVRLMNLKAKDRVSAVALVQESANGGNGNGARSRAKAASAVDAPPAELPEPKGNGDGEVKVTRATAPAAKPKAAKPKPAAAKPKRAAKPNAAKPKPATKAKPKAKKKSAAKPAAKRTAARKLKPNPPTVRGQARKKK